MVFLCIAARSQNLREYASSNQTLGTCGTLNLMSDGIKVLISHGSARERGVSVSTMAQELRNSGHGR